MPEGCPDNYNKHDRARDSPWAPLGAPLEPFGPPRDPQGTPKGPPRDPVHIPGPPWDQWSPSGTRGQTRCRDLTQRNPAEDINILQLERYEIKKRNRNPPLQCKSKTKTKSKTK